jgi:hypothetical protein
LSESSLSLLALPYRPNHAEYLALTHSGRILGDQMTFLQNQFSINSRGVRGPMQLAAEKGYAAQ